MPARLPFTIFQGGMPRASYGDRHCISVVHNGQQTAFDFTSRVIDFTVLIEANPEAGRRAGVSVEGRPPGGVGIGPTPIHKQRGRACRHPKAAIPESLSPIVPLLSVPEAAPFTFPAGLWLVLASHTSHPPQTLFALPRLSWDLAQRWADLHCWA